MVRYIGLFKFTEQGIKIVSETISRADAFKKAAQKAGAAVKSVYWTVGRYDGVIVFEAPDEQTAMGLLTKLGAAGNVRTETLRAFERGEMETILSKAR